MRFDNEKELEIYFKNNFRNDVFSDLRINKKSTVYNQFSMHLYGIVDLLFFHVDKDSMKIEIVVVELKNVKSSSKELQQLLRYVSGIIASIEADDLEKYNISVRGILLAPDYSVRDDFLYTVNHLNNIELFAFDINPFLGLSIEKIQ